MKPLIPLKDVHGSPSNPEHNNEDQKEKKER